MRDTIDTETETEIEVEPAEVHTSEFPFTFHSRKTCRYNLLKPVATGYLGIIPLYTCR